MKKILINGILGKMGKLIAARIQQHDEFKLIGGIDLKDISSSEYPFTVYSDIHSVNESIDVVIDFSLPEGTENVLDFIAEKRVGAIIGTTGLVESQQERMKTLSKDIPIVYSTNFSIGVNLFFDFIQYVSSRMIDKDYDIEIIESHHRHKKDAPSGTAKSLYQIIQKQLPSRDRIEYGRNGEKKRVPSEIGVHSIRGGGVFGIHEVQFLGENEILSFRHEALSREVFVDGIMYCLKQFPFDKPGLYSMRDILAFEKQGV